MVISRSGVGRYKGLNKFIPVVVMVISWSGVGRLSGLNNIIIKLSLREGIEAGAERVWVIKK